MLKANDGIMPQEEPSIVVDQVIGNQPASSLSTEAITVIIVVVLCSLYAIACYASDFLYSSHSPNH